MFFLTSLRFSVADQYPLESVLPLAEATSWLLGVNVLPVPTQRSMCRFTDFCSWGTYAALLHYSAQKGKHFRCKGRLISVVKKMKCLQGAKDYALYFLMALPFVTWTYLYFQVPPDLKKPIIQNPNISEEELVGLILFSLFSYQIHRFSKKLAQLNVQRGVVVESTGVKPGGPAFDTRHQLF